MSFNVEALKPFGALITPTQESESVYDLEVKEIRTIFEKEHLVVLRGFKTFSNKDEFSDYCEKWGEVSLWPFGKVLELIEQENPADHIFDNNYVPMHWDGMYRPKVPQIQIFHCVKSPEQNKEGRTTFSNTTMAVEKASASDRELWEKAVGVYERKMEFYHSKTEAPVITKHPLNDNPVIRYCEPPAQGDDSFLNHPNYEFTGIEKSEVSTLIKSLNLALYNDENFYAHSWESGDIVISDNHTLLHGREAFTSGSSRHIQRVHVLGEPGVDNPHLVFHS